MGPPGRIDPEIHARCGPADGAAAALAERQYGVVARRQLQALGLGHGAIDHRVSVGRLHPIHLGVYALGHRAIGREARWMAAVLAYPPGARLSHHSGAALWDLRPTYRTLIDVSVARRGCRRRPGIHLHRVRHLDARDVTTHRGIPVTTVARTLLDLAEVLRSEQLERAFEAAERLRLLDVAEIEAVCVRATGRRGRRVLAELLDYHRGPPPLTRSELERRFLDLCRSASLPLPLMNEEVPGFTVDAVWPEQRLVVELDSREFHRTTAAFERDRRRDAALLVAGYRVLRLTDLRLQQEPAVVVAQLRALL